MKLLFCCALLVVPLLAVAGAKADLVAWYKFDETAGNTAADSSTNANDMTITAPHTQAWVGGVAGNAISIMAQDGTHGVAPAIPAYDFGAGDFTISFWLRKAVASDGDSDFFAVSKWNKAAGGRDWSISASFGGQDDLAAFNTMNTSAATSADALPVGQWAHIAAVRRGGTVELWLNGEQQAVLAVGALVLPYSAAPLEIAGGGLSDANRCRGDYDDLQMYNQALTPAQMAFLYANPGNEVAPEPTTMALFGLGGVLAIAGGRRRK